jgi:hypothetical protein
MQFGSLAFLFMTLWSVLAVGVFYVAMAWVGATVSGDLSWMYMSAVGYSGVLFNYAILEAYHTTATTRSLCGFCDVPARMYPFVLLVAIQLLMPGISFLGHVSGVIVGLLLVYGPATVALPSPSFLEYLEGSTICGCLSKSNAYVRTTGKTFAVDGLASNGVTGACASLVSVVASMCRFIVDLFFTVLAVVGCPAESIAARARNFFTSFSRDAQGERDGPSSSNDDDLEGGGHTAGGGGSNALPWSRAQQYSPVATTEMTGGSSAGASSSSSSNDADGGGEPIVKANRAAVLAAAENRARQSKF